MENIIASLRSGARLALVFLWTAATWSGRLAFWPVCWFSESLDRRGRRWIMRVWGRGFRRIIGMRVEVHGPRPQPPYYLVANHLGYLDVFLFSGLLGSTFVARGDLEKWPVIGWISRSLHVLFINREQRQDAVRVNALIAHTLREGDGIVIFAESRISRGLAVEPFKSALIQPAIDNEMPVHYATISYATPAGALPPSEVIGWWRPEPFFFHVRRLLRQPRFTATIHFGEAPLAGTDRKALAAQLHEAVQAPFVPLA